MPRNPKKKHCQVPGCRSWAMRSHNHCRAHLDHLLGPRAAGAPQGNLNAVKSVANAHPFSSEELKQIALQLTQKPGSFVHHVTRAAQSIHGRAADPLTALLLLTRVLRQLHPYLADSLFAARLDAYLERHPPADRPGLRAQIWKHALPMSPRQKLLLIKAIANRIPGNDYTGKTINGIEASVPESV